jgi:glycosyltransferase involved in cell wall biosynthesis
MSEMNKDFVSIIIPNYNRQELVSVSLESLCQQTYSAWEALVVDDGSTDDSVKIIKNFCERDKRIRLFNRQRQPKGAPVCRNIGLENATGQYIIFLDSDDILAPWCLENRVEQFKKYPQYDCIVFPILHFSKTPGDADILWSKYVGDNALAQFINMQTPWQTMGPVWRKESVKKIGGWDESLATWQDWEFHIRALLKGIRYKIVDGLPDCFLRRSEHDRISAGDMKLTRLEAKLLLFKKVMSIIDKEKGTTEEEKKIFAGLYFNHAERAAINMPKEKIIGDFIGEMKALKVLPGFQVSLLVAYINLLRLARRTRLKPLVSFIYKIGHSILPPIVRPVVNKPVHLTSEEMGIMQKRMKEYVEC